MDSPSRACPVCGAVVDPLRARSVMIYGTSKFYFCGAAHRAAFAANPSQYLEHPVEPAVPRAERPPAPPPKAALPKLVLHETSQPTPAPAKITMPPLPEPIHPEVRGAEAYARRPAGMG